MPIVKRNAAMERVYIFDTTLRDGEQSPGASMSIDQKHEFALQLQRLGVDVIEAGFPVSSPHQFEACKAIAADVRDTTVAALARSMEKDITAAYESIGKAARPRIHTFIATSPIHMKHKLNKGPDEVLEMAVHAVSFARNLVAEVEFSPEDGTRSDPEFLYRIIEAVIDAGASVINIPDTVGYAVPEEYGALIKGIINSVPNIDKAVVSVHCHNDLGLGVANSIAAVKNGARQVEVTVNGIGERAGNAALEELVMAMRVRHQAIPYETGIVTTQLYPTSRLLANILGTPIPRNKPVVGENAFAHESGIHQDGMLKNRETYEIMTPQSVGKEKSSIVLGRHSGKHGFKTRLEELGFTLTAEEVDSTFIRFLEIADRKKEVYDEDLYTIVSEELGRQTAVYTLEYFNIISGNMAVPTATVRILTEDSTVEEAATGDGPVDAVFRAIDRVIGIKTTLKEFIVHAITPGKQAMGEVSVTIEIDDFQTTGRGSSTDIIEASARAYVNALNRFKTFQQQQRNGS
jgi:2-isopropylmalate synthase